MLSRILATLMLCALATTTQAQELRLPVLEIGVAGGGGYVPDYPAAGEGRVRGIAAPYLIYRGEILRSDDRGARLRAALSDDIEFSLSASGSLPVSSSDNDARRGMPDLDLLGEIGPTLRLTLWRGTAAAYPVRLLLDTPLRAVFSTDFTSISFRGVTFSPDVSLEARNIVLPFSRLRASLGVTFASDRFMEYFYEVRPEFARADRPAYGAKAGYLGARASLSYRFPLSERLSAAVSARVDYFGGAANRDSPLFRRDINASATVGFAYSFWRSEERIAVDTDVFD